MEEQYENLSEETEKYKARVEWRLARLKLSEARKEMWEEVRQQEKELRERIGKERFGMDDVSVASGNQLGKAQVGVSVGEHKLPVAAEPTCRQQIDQGGTAGAPVYPTPATECSSGRDGGGVEGDNDTVTLQHVILDGGQTAGVTGSVTSRGMPPDPSDNFLQERGECKPDVHVTSRGRAPLSTLQHLLHGDNSIGDTYHVSSRGMPPASTDRFLQEDGEYEPDLHLTSRGRAPLSTLQYLLQDDYRDDDPYQLSSKVPLPPRINVLQGEVKRDASLPQVNSRGTPPPSTVQNLMYPKDVISSLKESVLKRDSPAALPFTDPSLSFRYPDQFPGLGTSLPLV